VCCEETVVLASSLPPFYWELCSVTEHAIARATGRQFARDQGTNKMISKTVLLLMAVASLLMTNKASAHIGWTLDQCKKHYGEPAEVHPENADDTVKNYLFHNVVWGPGLPYEISAEFSNGTCVVISYYHPNFEQFTSKEIENLVSVSSNGYIWTRTRTTSKEIDYSAHLDGKVAFQAFYGFKGELMIATTEWWNRND
jgi:hypothetical protein